jgi:hypothetical protein
MKEWDESTDDPASDVRIDTDAQTAEVSLNGPTGNSA